MSKNGLGRPKKDAKKNPLVGGLLKEVHEGLEKSKAEIEKFDEQQDENLNALHQINIQHYNWMINVTAAEEGLRNCF